MKRLYLIICILTIGIGLNAQDCPSVLKAYTTAEYIYSCQSNNNTNGQDSRAFIQSLAQDALNSLAKQFEVKVESKSISKLWSENGVDQEFFSSISELTTNVTLRLAHTKEYYDSSRKEGWVIAYINKLEARQFYKNEYTQAVSKIRTIIDEAEVLIDYGLHARARDEKLPETEQYFHTAYEVLAWLNIFGYSETELQSLLNECEQLRLQLTAMIADLKHGIAIYMKCTADINGETYSIFASEIKGKMESAGCHFVENEAEADWIIVANAEVSRTQHYLNMAFFCWIDGKLTITNASTGRVIYENQISEIEAGHKDGIKGDGDTYAYEPSARDGYKQAARIIAEKALSIIIK